MQFSFSDEFLKQYQIIRVIGEGGFGRVYEGRQLTLGRNVAIKCLLPKRTGIAEHLKRFRREAHILASLNHPNIIQIFDYGVDNGIPYIVEELLEGQPLEELIEDKGKLPPSRVVAIGSQISEALGYAHSREVIHRDLKPANIFISPEDKVTVLDFGLAKATDDSTAITETGNLVGTYLYMAPEVLQGKNYGPPADIYALAIVLYHALSEDFPHHLDSPQSVMKKVFDRPQPLAKAAPFLPRGLCTAIDSALVSEPTDRTQNAATFARDLNDGLQQKLLPIRKTSPKTKRHCSLALLTTLLTFGILYSFSSVEPNDAQKNDGNNLFESVETIKLYPTAAQIRAFTKRKGRFEATAFSENIKQPIRRISSDNEQNEWIVTIDRLPSGTDLKLQISVASAGCGTKTTDLHCKLPSIHPTELSQSFWDISRLRPRAKLISPITGPPVLHQNRLYIGLGKTLVCFDLNGNLLWKRIKRVPTEQLVISANSLLALSVLNDVASHSLLDGKLRWAKTFRHEVKKDVLTNEKFLVLREGEELWLVIDSASGKDHWSIKDGSLRTPYYLTKDNIFIAQTRFTLNVVSWNVEKKHKQNRLPIVERTGYITTPIYEDNKHCVIGMGTGRIHMGPKEKAPELVLTIKGVPKMFDFTDKQLFCYSLLPCQLFAFNKASGRRLWHKDLDFEVERLGSVMLSACSMVAHRKRLYLLDSEGTIHCYDGRTGLLLWHYVALACRKFGLLRHPDGILFCSGDRKLALIQDGQRSLQ